MVYADHARVAAVNRSDNAILALDRKSVAAAADTHFDISFHRRKRRDVILSH
jgi:hypothetical protein